MAYGVGTLRKKRRRKYDRERSGVSVGARARVQLRAKDRYEQKNEEMPEFEECKNRKCNKYVHDNEAT